MPRRYLFTPDAAPSGAISVYVTGFLGSSALGDESVSGKANTYPTTLLGTSALGDGAVSGKANVYPTGNSASALLGSISVDVPSASALFIPLRPTPYSAQPPASAVIDQRHPLARGLIAAWNGQNPTRNAVGSTASVVGTGVSQTTTRFGRALDTTGAGTGGLYLPTMEGVSNTFVYTGVVRTAAASDRLISSFNGVSAGRFEVSYPSPLTTLSIRTYCTSADGEWTVDGLTTFAGTLVVSQPQTTTPHVFLNGVELSLTQLSAVSGLPDPANNAFSVNYRLDNSRQTDGYVAGVLRYNRAVSKAEARLLSLNPWQVWIPPQSGLVVSTSTTTVSIPVYGLSAASALGTPAVVAKAVVAATGIYGTSHIGSVTAIAKAIANATGVQGTSALGDAAIRAAASVSPTGVVGTTTLNGVLVTVGGGTTVLLTGVQGTSALGEETIRALAQVSATGVGGVAVLGAVSVDLGSIRVHAVGITATGQVGAVLVQTAGNTYITVTGLQGVSALGTPLIWGLVDTVDDALWAAISTGINDPWTDIISAQDPLWTPIKTS